MKALQTSMMRGPGVCGHNMGVAPAAPVHSIDDYLAYLFDRHGALETPPIVAPNQSHFGTSLKDKPHG